MSDGLEHVWRQLEAGAGDLTHQAVYGVLTLILAAVFIFSGVPKFRRPELAALAIVDFGITRRAHRWMGTALGAGEVSLAALLALGASAGDRGLSILASLLATVVLWTFSALIARSLLSADRFACFCFGSADTISGVTLLRTTLLAGFATVVGIASFAEISSASVADWSMEVVIAAAVIGGGSILASLPRVLEVSA